MKNENTTASVGLPPGPDGETMGVPFFKCKSETFHNCMKGRDKNKHWKKFISDSELTDRIKHYMKSNKGKKFALKDETTGTMVFADKKFNFYD